MPANVVSAIANQIDALDSEAFSFLETQTLQEDRRALLALHAAAADTFGSFAYLEIGSYLGGSLQVLMRDPRCRSVISIDLRTGATPDDRGQPASYEGNSTEHMLELLRELPDVDMDKLTTLETGTDRLTASDLPARPNYCFIDGEHTHDAVVRDARFSAEALGGSGVIAFHDYFVIGSAISSFLREVWRDVSFALAFSGSSDLSAGGGVFALELGAGGVLKHPVIERAIGSRWHNMVWRAANLPRRTALPFLVAWATMPAVDSFVIQTRRGFQAYVRR